MTGSTIIPLQSLRAAPSRKAEGGGRSEECERETEAGSPGPPRELRNLQLGLTQFTRVPPEMLAKRTV